MKDTDELINELYARRDEYVKTKKKRMRTVRNISVTLCIALLICAIPIGLFMTSGGEMPILPDNSQNFPETSSSVEHESGYVPSGIKGLLYAGDPAAFEAERGSAEDIRIDGIVITAVASELLPGTYTRVDSYSSARFRLYRMRTVNCPSQEGMPDEFYMQVPCDGFADLTAYDSLVLCGMVQAYVENAVFYRTDTKSYESLPLTVFRISDIRSDMSYYPHEVYSKIFPILGGVFDASLWREHVDMLSYPNLEQTAAECSVMTPAEVERYAAEHNYRDPYTKYTVHSLGKFAGLDALSQAAVDSGSMFIQAESFAQIYSKQLSAYYRKYHKGFRTSEVLFIGEEGPKTIGFKFEADELNALPDLSVAIAALEEEYLGGEMQPPHIPASAVGSMNFGCHSITGNYYKGENGAFGVVSVRWLFVDDHDGEGCCIDEQLYLVTDGSCTPVSAAELNSIIGPPFKFEDRICGSYDENGVFNPIFTCTTRY